MEHQWIGHSPLVNQGLAAPAGLRATASLRTGAFHTRAAESNMAASRHMRPLTLSNKMSKLIGKLQSSSCTSHISIVPVIDGEGLPPRTCPSLQKVPEDSTAQKATWYGQCSAPSLPGQSRVPGGPRYMSATELKQVTRGPFLRWRT